MNIHLRILEFTSNTTATAAHIILKCFMAQQVCNLPTMLEPTRDVGLIPSLGRSLEGENGNPIQYTCLKNPTVRGHGGLQYKGWQRVGHVRVHEPWCGSPNGGEYILCTDHECIIYICHLILLFYGFFKKYNIRMLSVSCSVMSDSLQPHGLQPTRLFYLWNSPGKTTGLGSHSLVQM